MKEKAYRMWVVLGMAVILFLKASQHMDYQMENVELNIETVIVFKWRNMREEADMMLGRIVEITPERLVTYGPERGLGTQEGRDCFTNYIVETYSIENSHYGYSKKKYQGEMGWNEGLEFRYQR